MDEQGFEFKPAERRDPRRFEPPPWEQDAFEQRRREREAAQQEQKAAEEPAPQEGARVTEPGRPDEGLPTERPAVDQQARAARPVQEGAALDDGKVAEMLQALTVEDPPVDLKHGKVSAAVAISTMALGAVLIMWGMAAFVGARDTGAFGSFTGVGLALFGVFFVSAGAWLLYRTLKQQGVL